MYGETALMNGNAKLMEEQTSCCHHSMYWGMMINGIGFAVLARSLPVFQTGRYPGHGCRFYLKITIELKFTTNGRGSANDL